MFGFFLDRWSGFSLITYLYLFLFWNSSFYLLKLIGTTGIYWVASLIIALDLENCNSSCGLEYFFLESCFGYNYYPIGSYEYFLLESLNILERIFSLKGLTFDGDGDLLSNLSGAKIGLRLRLLVLIKSRFLFDLVVISTGSLWITRKLL